MKSAHTVRARRDPRAERALRVVRGPDEDPQADEPAGSGRQSVDGDSPVDGAAHSLVVATARSLPPIDPLEAQVAERLLEAFPAFGEDTQIEQEMRVAIRANLRKVFDEVMPSPDGEALRAPPEALEFAASVLNRQIDTSELIQAYRVGQNLAWSWWMEHLALQVEDRALLIEAIDLSSGRMFAYVDTVVDEQVHLWEEERRRWAGRLVARRAEAVRRVLIGDIPTAEEATRALGFSVERELVAGVLWEELADASNSAMNSLERTADAIARGMGLGRTLIVPAGPSSLWAWFATDDDLGLQRLTEHAERHLQDRQGVAFGLPTVGLGGFRVSHRQALRARRIGELSSESGGIVRFDLVEALCLMGDDLDLLGGFVARQLGPLAAPTAAAERLRETVLAWLREGGNARSAAERLHTHRNTVLYRVRRAEQVLRRPLIEDRLALELALAAAERMGLPPYGA